MCRRRDDPSGFDGVDIVRWIGALAQRDHSSWFDPEQHSTFVVVRAGSSARVRREHGGRTRGSNTRVGREGRARGSDASEGQARREGGLCERGRGVCQVLTVERTRVRGSSAGVRHEGRTRGSDKRVKREGRTRGSSASESRARGSGARVDCMEEIEV